MRLSSLLPSLSRWGRAAFALGSLALLSGCDLNFWRMDGPQSTMVVEGPVARTQLQVFYVTVWVTAIIFVLVAAALAYATLKFRAKDEKDEHAEPPAQSHGNPLIELGLIGASVLALVVIAVPTLRAIWYTHDVPQAERENAYVIEATGLQWWFRFSYPNEQIEGAGPLVTANELVIPAGRPVRVNLRTSDVIHSFWVPKLAGKVDMIPNRGNFLWLQADEPGYFWGQCAEYCGDSHAVMRFRVIALGAKEFNEWLDQQLSPARTVAAVDSAPAPQAQMVGWKTEWKRNEPGYSQAFDAAPLDSWRAHQLPVPDENAALVAKGRETFRAKNCITCHQIRGHEGIGLNAPDLTHVGARTTIAGGLLENTPEQLARWISHPNEVKPGNKMWAGIGAMNGYASVDKYGTVTARHIELNSDDVVALVAYLQSLK